MYISILRVTNEWLHRDKFNQWRVLHHTSGESMSGSIPNMSQILAYLDKTHYTSSILKQLFWFGCLWFDYIAVVHVKKCKQTSKNPFQFPFKAKCDAVVLIVWSRLVGIRHNGYFSEDCSCICVYNNWIIKTEFGYFILGYTILRNSTRSVINRYKRGGIFILTAIVEHSTQPVLPC